MTKCRPLTSGASWEMMRLCCLLVFINVTSAINMLCKELLPSDPNDPLDPELTSQIRAVGSVVRALCANRTVAILECQPNLLWNGTLPTCTESVSDISNLSSILIIVWVIGGVLLFTLLILIAIIIGSRHKTIRRISGPQSSQVFHISGQGEGGDNPAFSRSEERCASSSRLTSPGSNSRLPSYQEAIRDLYGRASPSRSSSSPSSSPSSEPYFIRANAPPSYRSSHLYQPATIHASTTQTPTASTTVNERDTTREGQRSPLPQRRAATASTPVSTTTNVGCRTESTEQQQPSPQLPARYAESYPRCLWEEDPPPPYTPGPNNLNLYRSPVRTSQSRSAIRRSLPSRSRPAPPIPTTTHNPTTTTTPAPNTTSTCRPQPSAPQTNTAVNCSSNLPGMPSQATSQNNILSTSQHHHQPTHTTVAPIEHPLITYTSPCPATNGASGGFYSSTIHVTNDHLVTSSSAQRNMNSQNLMPFPPIQPTTNQNPSLHSMLPLFPHSQILGPPLSSSTPVPSPAPVRRNNDVIPTQPNHMPPPPPPPHNSNNRLHSPSQSHGSDSMGHSQTIPRHHRPLPRPRPHQSQASHHQRQQSAPIARLEVEYF